MLKYSGIDQPTPELDWILDAHKQIFVHYASRMISCRPVNCPEVLQHK